MGIIGGHSYELLIVLAVLAALIALIYVAVSRFHRHLHRHM
jgi:uncharacterized protein (UPF0333 family)